MAEPLGGGDRPPGPRPSGRKTKDPWGLGGKKPDISPLCQQRRNFTMEAMVLPNWLVQWRRHSDLIDRPQVEIHPTPLDLSFVLHSDNDIRL